MIQENKEQETKEELPKPEKPEKPKNSSPSRLGCATDSLYRGPQETAWSRFWDMSGFGLY